jgi:dTDP-glucose 4,6-dehydratase
VGGVYIVGGWNEKANLKVVTTLCDILDADGPRLDGRSYHEQIAFVADRPDYDRRHAIDAGKLERELGWKPFETFESGIRETVRWYLDNQEWGKNVTSGAYPGWGGKHYDA